MAFFESLAKANLTCILVKTTDQNLGVGTDESVLFNDADIFDTRAMHDPLGANPEQITIVEPGVYLILGSITVAAGIAACVSGAWLVVDGVVHGQNHATPPAAGAAHTISCFWCGALEAGDIIVLHATNDVGGAAGLTDASLIVMKIADAIK